MHSRHGSGGHCTAAHGVMRKHVHSFIHSLGEA
jgi:hypothetical protein